jgi:hypothetical protein
LEVEASFPCASGWGGSDPLPPPSQKRERDLNQDCLSGTPEKKRKIKFDLSALLSTPKVEFKPQERKKKLRPTNSRYKYLAWRVSGKNRPRREKFLSTLRTPAKPPGLGVADLCLHPAQQNTTQLTWYAIHQATSRYSGREIARSCVG